MLNQLVQHRVGIIIKGKKNNIKTCNHLLQVLTNILCLLLQTSEVIIEDCQNNPTNMGSLAILTMDIIKTLGKKKTKYCQQHEKQPPVPSDQHP